MGFYWLIGGKRFKKSCATVHKFIDKFIDSRKQKEDENAANGDRYIFFNTIANSTKDRAAIRSQLLNVLLAGRDTTACLLS
jgi:cytochrome P450